MRRGAVITLPAANRDHARGDEVEAAEEIQDLVRRVDVDLCGCVGRGEGFPSVWLPDPTEIIT